MNWCLWLLMSLALVLCLAFGRSDQQRFALQAFDSTVRLMSQDRDEDDATTASLTASLPALPRPSPVTQRKRPTPLQSKQIAAKQGFKCAACGRMLDATWEIDHILPLRAGGDNNESNLRALHRSCHQQITSRQNMKA